MADLSQAPLIEAIFELRWGEMKSKDTPQRGIEFFFNKSNEALFAEQFQSAMIDRGFVVHERVHEELPQLTIPHIVTDRFRPAENTWPCYQTGLGIFSANQVNDGYAWEQYKADVLHGLELFDPTHPLGLDGLPSIGVELRYQDGFVLEEGETPSQFLKDKLEINFTLHNDFLSLPAISSDPQGSKIVFNLKLNDPEGILLISLDEAYINGQMGFVMSTTVRSADGAQPAFVLDELEEWLEKAHDVQRHAFVTLINKTYARTFE